MADEKDFDDYSLADLQNQRHDETARWFKYQMDWNQRFDFAPGETRRELQDEFQRKAEIYHEFIAILDDVINKRKLIVQQLKGLLTTAEIVIQANNNRHVIRALLDNGSEASYISMELADKLELRKICHKSESHGIGPAAANAAYITEAEILSKSGAFKQSIICVVNDSKLKDHPLERLNLSGMLIPNDIELADPKCDVPGTIDIMLGAKVQLHISESLSRPYGQTLNKSQFGWIVGGNSEPVETNAMLVMKLSITAGKIYLNFFLELKQWKLHRFRHPIKPALRKIRNASLNYHGMKEKKLKG